MAGISPWAWLGIGGLLTVVSLWLGGKLTVFLYIGLFFLAVGAAKAVIWYVTRPKETPAEQAAVRQQVAQPAQRVAAQYVNCPRCGLLTYSQANYCHNCGTPIKTAPARQAPFDPAAYLQRLRR
jgi:Flp pilus assembly protein protease CpaA